MRIILINLTVVLFVLVGFIHQFQPILKADNHPVVFKIEKNASFAEIAGKLKSSGLIRSKLAFEFYSILSGRARRFQNGGYYLSPAMSVFQLAEILSAGPSEILIIISPGMTLKEIDDALSKRGIIENGALISYNENKFGDLRQKYSFLDSKETLEGFLLPDNYYFYLGSDIEAVIEKILDNFKRKVLPLVGVWQLTFSGEKDKLYELLIIASLLEKEVPDYEDRRIVAGIIEKRLEAGMPLQIDATIIYAKCDGRFLDCLTLKSEDYTINSSFNTYRELGLTPAPIGNPGLDAIKAAINKKNSEYWYYLSDPKTKKTIFGKTFDEHSRNRRKYLMNNR